MKILKKSYDGGPDSGVTGYWLIEWKQAFSIVLLHFSPGSREAFHSHAFNAVTLWLKGQVAEVDLQIPMYETKWKPGQFKWTPRNKFHMIIGPESGAWALSFRGPWQKNWQEYKYGKIINLADGRLEV